MYIFYKEKSKVDGDCRSPSCMPQQQAVKRFLGQSLPQVIHFPLEKIQLRATLWNCLTRPFLNI